LNFNIWQCCDAQWTNQRSTELFDSRCTLHLSLKLSCLYMMFINFFVLRLSSFFVFILCYILDFEFEFVKKGLVELHVCALMVFYCLHL
jgi:hypothetical protein